MLKDFRWIKVNLKTTFLVMALGIASIAQAQRLPPNQPNYDNKVIHFGFSLGVNYYDFNIEQIADLSTVPGYFSVRSETSPGYTIGIISNLRLGKYFDLRFIPAFASTERRLYFDVINPKTGQREEVLRKIESSFGEATLELKWKSQRIKNYRLYVLGGGKYTHDFASKEKVEDDRVFKLTQGDFMYEFGFGVDFYFEFFKFSPQIKASWGVSDLMVADGTFYVEGIHRLETRAILINFTFE